MGCYSPLGVMLVVEATAPVVEPPNIEGIRVPSGRVTHDHDPVPGPEGFGIATDFGQLPAVVRFQPPGLDRASGLFDFDRHNTLYFFALNTEEQIYLRYGGRTAESPTSRLDLESLVLALEKGLARVARSGVKLSMHRNVMAPGTNSRMCQIRGRPASRAAIAPCRLFRVFT